MLIQKIYLQIVKKTSKKTKNSMGNNYSNNKNCEYEGKALLDDICSCKREKGECPEQRIFKQDLICYKLLEDSTKIIISGELEEVIDNTESKEKGL